MAIAVMSCDGNGHVMACQTQLPPWAQASKPQTMSGGPLGLRGPVPAMRRGLLVLALLWCCQLLPNFMGGGPPANEEPQEDWKDLAYQRQMERT